VTYDHVTGLLHAVLVVAGPFDHSRAGPVPALRVEMRVQGDVGGDPPGDLVPHLGVRGKKPPGR
jgi:hypothetical protein